jgi:hypothetical protein
MDRWKATKTYRPDYQTANCGRQRSLELSDTRGVPMGDAQDARASPLCIPPPGHVHPPPPQPERLVMRKDEAVGNKKKMQVCLPKH